MKFNVSQQPFSKYLQERTRERYKKARKPKAELDNPWSVDKKYVLHGMTKEGWPVLRDRGPLSEDTVFYIAVPSGKELKGPKAPKERGTKPALDTAAALTFTYLKDSKFDKRLFDVMKSGTPIDGCFSQDGGIFPGTNYVIVGDPGVGKSTVLFEHSTEIKATGKRVLFIQCEMNRIDMYGYLQRFDKLGDIPFMFMADHTGDDSDVKALIEKALEPGWDLVYIDSSTELVDDLVEQGMSRRKAEAWLIDQMVKHNEGKNESNSFTSFMVIAQVNKGGSFVGTNKWKHNTTGMLELRYTDKEEITRAVIVKKNRRGFTYPRLPFVVGSDSVKYREELVLADQEREALAAQQRLDVEKQEADFRERFKNLAGGLEDLGAKDEEEEEEEEELEEAEA